MSEPCARNAPRQTAASSSREPVVSRFGQAADRPAARIEQAGLAGEGLAAVEHADEVLAGAAEAGCRDHGDLAAHAVELGEVFAHAAGELGRVELALHRDPAADQVQAAGEPQDASRVLPRGPWSC